MKKIFFCIFVLFQVFAFADFLPFDQYKGKVSPKLIQEFNAKYKNCDEVKTWEGSCNEGSLKFWDKVLNLEYGLIRNSLSFDKKAEHENF